MSVVIDARDRGLPEITHWGAALGDLDVPALEAVIDAQRASIPSEGRGGRVPFSLVPEASRGHKGRLGLRGHRNGRDWSSSFALADVQPTDKASGTPSAVIVTAQDEYRKLRLTSELELTAAGLLRMRHTVENTGDEAYVLDALEVALPLPAEAGELLDLTGRWARERHPQRRPFGVGSWVRESRRGRTGLESTLAMLAGTPGFGFQSGEVWAAHVAWSGNHVTYAERLPVGTAAIGGGELLMSGEVILRPSDSYSTPWLYAAYSDHGIDGVSEAFHGWMRSRPQHVSRPRPVVLNTWEAVYFDHNLDRLKGLADTAADIGVERFVLDDGWFRHRRNDTAGLGDWFVDEDVWPDGLTPLIDHVSALNMEFGLWVEPEMINPDSDLYRAHPDWVLRPSDDGLPPLWRHQQVLGLANRDAYAYILERLDALLRENDIAYLKWDHNRDLIDAGHEGRPGVRLQTLAVYRLLDELRERHPSVEIESCSSGGGRVDLEILQRTDRIWASDCNDALERQTIQRWTTLLVPPEMVGAHVGPPTAHTTGRTHDLTFRVNTALFGHFGLEWDVTTASADELDALRQAISFYKDVRGLLHVGRVVRVDYPDPSAMVHGVVADDRSRALLCFAQVATSERGALPPVRVHGLDPDRLYRVDSVAPAGEPMAARGKRPPWMSRNDVVLSGRVLSAVGVRPPTLSPEHAALISFEAVPR